MNLFHPIHHTFAPLGNRQQCMTALTLLFRPWAWKRGTHAGMMESELQKRFGGEAFTFGSGRESLLAVLQALKLKKEEEVIVQGYTCIVVPNAVIAAGMKPVYADIEQGTLNLDLSDVERRITPHTRAVICQHTFGIPAFTKELRALCDRHSLLLIEDCAHVIPDEQGPRDIGAHGDILFFSFGRDKAVSGVAGGAVVCRNAALCPEIKRQHDEARDMGYVRIKRLLLYPLIYALCRPLYGTGVGKALLALCGEARLLVPIVTAQEKNARMKPVLYRMPDACARLALEQLHALDAINGHRRKLTALYLEEGTKRNWPVLPAVRGDLPLQKFPLFVEEAEGIRQKLRTSNIHLHDGWTGCVICPANADSDAACYRDGDDPDAEMAGQQILSLPTHPGTSELQARRLIETLDALLAQ